jgi:hypothetical protein
MKRHSLRSHAHQMPLLTPSIHHLMILMCSPQILETKKRWNGKGDSGAVRPGSRGNSLLLLRVRH